MADLELQDTELWYPGILTRNPEILEASDLNEEGTGRIYLEDLPSLYKAAPPRTKSQRSRNLFAITWLLCTCPILVHESTSQMIDFILPLES